VGATRVSGRNRGGALWLIPRRGGRRKLLAAYERLHQALTVPHRDVVEFIRGRGLHGRGVGWIDIHLLASARVARVRLWTADPRFSAVAAAVGVGCEPASSAGRVF
jgi:predicted nucleic acid-binding protein